MKNFAKALVLTLIFCATGVYAQTNLLINGGFEQNLAPQYGDNLDWNIAPWVPEFDDRSNVVQVDGPGGNTSYGNFGPASDATGGAEQQHYYNQIGPHSVYQQFTPVCSGEVNYGAYFSTREGKEGRGEILILDPSSSNQIGLPAVVNLPPGGDSENDPWVLAASSATLTANTDYVFYVVFDGNPNMDNAYVAFETDCVVDDIDPSDVTLTKTCEPPVPHQNNNALGQRWECRVDVSVPTTPFAGSITLNDVFTNTSLVSSQVLLGQSLSGNGNCSQGDCMIEGADFDASGTETFRFDIFVEAVETADVYPLENCVSGALVAETGTSEPIAQSCATGQWTPTLDTTKSCDPLVDMGAGNFELTCELTVVASGLDPNEYVVLADLFAGQNTNSTPPLGALPFQTNFSYSDPWNCGAPPNANAPYEWCEISVADLNAAGGSSTITSTTTFQNPEDFDQAFNCLIGGSGEAQSPYNKNQSNQFDSLKMAARSATRNPSSQFGDDCVVLDLPDPGGSTNPEKLESVRLRKMCDDPVQGTHNGAQGYFWNCDIDIMVQPAPFNGTFTLTEDASNISSGQAEFVGASVAPCTGIGSDTISCDIDGNAMTQPHPVSVQLFTEIVSGEEPVEWQNCASGRAETSAAAMSSGKTCFQTLIKPIVVTDPPKELAVKKSCDADPVLTTLNGVEGISWTCEITAVANPAPFSGIFAIHEDATSITGTSTGEIVAMTPQNNAWACAANLPSSQTSCQISGAAFDPSGEETIRVDLFAPVGKEPITWENCVGGIYTQSHTQEEEIGGNCQTMTWNPEPGEPTFDIEKVCEAAGVRQEFSPGNWVQPYACTLTVTTNGMPFSHPLLVADAMSYGTFSGNSLVGQLTSSDPWQCVQPPYAAPGQGTQPACIIQGSDFPHANGSSSINFVMTIQGNVADQYGAQNCGKLYTTIPTDSTEPPIVAQSCVTIVDPPVVQEPTLSVFKTCSPAVRTGGNGPWTVSCNVTVNGANLPSGHQIRITDELTGAGLNAPTGGGFNQGLFTQNCGNAAVSNGIGEACDITTDDITNAGGSLTFPYSGSLNGPGGRSLPGFKYPQNCTYATLPSIGLNAPDTGKVCVEIPLELSAIGGGIPDLGTGAPAVLDEGMAVLDPNINPIPFKPSLSVVKFQTEACVANRNTQRYTCGFRLGVTNSGPGAFSGPMVLTDTFTSPGGQAVTVLSGGGWSCANPVNGAISCENASLTLAPGATSNIDLSMQVQGLVRGGSFQNCAALGIPDDRRQRVAAIQQVMNARGLNAGPVDGQPGRRTYAALAELQRSLGLPVSQSFDDGLFRALGLVLQEPGKQSCITVDLPRMPPAPLQCDAATTVPRGESCACRYDNMIQRNTASCQCRAGYVFTADRGCTPAPKPDPTPTPRPTPDTPRPAPDTPSQPRCENGLPRVNGKCLSIQIMPGGGGDGPAGADGCTIMVGGVCIK